MTTNTMMHRKSSDSCFRRRRRFGGVEEEELPGAMAKLGSAIVAELVVNVACEVCCCAVDAVTRR